MRFIGLAGALFREGDIIAEDDYSSESGDKAACFSDCSASRIMLHLLVGDARIAHQRCIIIIN